MGNKVSEQLPKSAGKDWLRLLVHERVAGGVPENWFGNVRVAW